MSCPGARTCAVEICSLSKTAGFTGRGRLYGHSRGFGRRLRLRLNQTARPQPHDQNQWGFLYHPERAERSSSRLRDSGKVRENIQVYKSNAKLLTDVLDKLGVRDCGGKNAPYIWMKCPDGLQRACFFDRLLHEIQVVGTPGEGFGACGEGYFRFSTFGDPEDTKEAGSCRQTWVLGRR